jgi:hypothetical protein
VLSLATGIRRGDIGSLTTWSIDGQALLDWRSQVLGNGRKGHLGQGDAAQDRHRLEDA